MSSRRSRRPRLLIALGSALALVALAAAAQNDRGFREPVSHGPFRVDVDRVLDGWRFNLSWQQGPGGRYRGRFHLSDVHTASATSTRQRCEREVGVATRDFVRDFIRGKRLRTRDVRPGRDRRTMVGLLDVEGEDLSTVLLERGLAMPYNDSRIDPAQRRWDCSKNEEAKAALRAAGIEVR